MPTTIQEKSSVKKIESAAITSFISKIKGSVILPDNPSYEDARKVYNAMINKYPGMIVICADVADVIEAVNFARENNLLAAVRGGGHNGGGLGCAMMALLLIYQRSALFG